MHVCLSRPLRQTISWATNIQHWKPLLQSCLYKTHLISEYILFQRSEAAFPMTHFMKFSFELVNSPRDMPENSAHTYLNCYIARLHIKIMTCHNDDMPLLRCQQHTDRSKAWDRISEDNVECLIVLCQWMPLIVADELHDWTKRQRLNKAKLAVLMHYLYQLVTLVFPVMQYKRTVIYTSHLIILKSAATATVLCLHFSLMQEQCKIIYGRQQYRMLLN